MGLSTSIRLPRLRDKLFVLYAYSDIRTDAQLAEKIGVKPGTISGYLSGTQTAAREMVPQSARDQLGQLLAAVLGNISEVDARGLWLADDFDRFTRAFQAMGDKGLTEILAQGERLPKLRYLPGGDDEVRGVYWGGPGPAADRTLRFAEIGDTFALEVVGKPEEWLVVLAAGPDGTTVAPGIDKVGASGQVLLPVEGMELPQFQGLPGPHRFVAIASEGSAPLSLCAVPSGEPVTDRDWAALRRELWDNERVVRWSYDTLLVQVRPAR